jgi:hypothetical protein
VSAFLTTPAGVRWLGFAGALCCAADAVLFGAPTWIRRGVSVWSILTGPNGILIMVLWIAGLAALSLAWWHGRRLELSRRWILTTAALWTLPLVAVPPLASRDLYAYACQGAVFNAGFNPSVDPIAAMPCPWIDSVSVVWRTTPTPYGPLWIVLAGLAASFGSQAVALAVFRSYAILALAGLAAAVCLLARTLGVREERALWLVVCCPLIYVHFIGGAHNDTLAMAFLATGLALVLRGGPGLVTAGGAREPGLTTARGPGLTTAGGARGPWLMPGLTTAGGARGPWLMPGLTAAGGARGPGLMIAGGALIGAAIAVKTTVGVVLPFAVLLAAGGLRFDRASLGRFVRAGLAVAGGVAAALVAVSLASGLGFGWAVALSGAGESRSWTSPPTAVGLAVDAVGKWFGAELDAVPFARTVALVVMLVALVAIWWRFRSDDPLHGAGLACLVVIFCAPITQPWYLIWVLVLLAVSTAPTRWLELTIIAAMFLILPNGDGAWKPLQVPLSFLVTGLVVWVAVRSVRRFASAPSAPAPAADGT